MKRIDYISSDQKLHQQIIDLLCEAFGARYRDYYQLQLQTLLAQSHTKLLADDEGQLVAFAQIVDYHLRQVAGRPPLRAAYLYSVSTAQSYQGQGVMSHFMEEILGELIADGYALAFLVPAEDWLVKYYKKFGFTRQDSVIFEKVPKGATPLLYPGEKAREYLREVASYEQKHPSQGQYERQRYLDWIPLLPAPICWMSLPLQEGLLIGDVPLLNPLT